MTLNEFAVALLMNGGANGGLTYLLARKIFLELPQWDINPTARQKRGLVYLLSFGLALVGLGLSAWLGLAPFTPDTTFIVFTTGFSVSQALHAFLDLDKVSVDLPRGALRVSVPKK